MGLKASDTFVLTFALLTAWPSFRTSAFLELIFRHVKLKFFLEHNVGHLDAFWAVKRSIWGIFCFLSGFFRLPMVACIRHIDYRGPLGSKQALVHLLFGQLKSILEGLRWKDPAWLIIFCVCFILLNLVLLEDTKQLELLPQLLLHLENLGVSGCSIGYQLPAFFVQVSAACLVEG